MSADSSPRVAIARAHEAFLAGLPEELRVTARRLPQRLGLTTRAELGWSEVFESESELGSGSGSRGDLILGLPTLLLTQLERPSSPELHASAQRAHLFAMISARVIEGVECGRVEVDLELDALLLAIERERHRALAELRLLGADSSISFSAAERDLRSATAAEREVFEARAEASLPGYVAICSGKQSLAFPATMAAVVAAGAELDELHQVHELILGLTLGVAVRAEVVHWLERARARRSWAVALIRSGVGEQTEVIAAVLGLAADAFSRAAASARVLEAEPLVRWVELQTQRVRALARAEAEAPGHALARARARPSAARAVEALTRWRSSERVTR